MQKFIVHTIESAPEKSKPTLRGMQQKFGFLPNIMGTMAENPVLLNGFAASFGSFHGGVHAIARLAIDLHLTLLRQNDPVLFHFCFGVEAGALAVQAHIRNGDLNYESCGGRMIS